MLYCLAEQVEMMKQKHAYKNVNWIRIVRQE